MAALGEWLEGDRARATRRGAAHLRAPRVPTLPALHVVGRGHHAALRRRTRGAGGSPSLGRRPVVPPARGGGEPAHSAGGRRVAGRRAERVRDAQGPALRHGRRGTGGVPPALPAPASLSAPARGRWGASESGGRGP